MTYTKKAFKIHTSHLKFCHTSRGGTKIAQEKRQKDDCEIKEYQALQLGFPLSLA